MNNYDKTPYYDWSIKFKIKITCKNNGVEILNHSFIFHFFQSISHRKFHFPFAPFWMFASTTNYFENVKISFIFRICQNVLFQFRNSIVDNCDGILAKLAMEIQKSVLVLIGIVKTENLLARPFFLVDAIVDSDRSIKLVVHGFKWFMTPNLNPSIFNQWPPRWRNIALIL